MDEGTENIGLPSYTVLSRDSFVIVQDDPTGHIIEDNTTEEEHVKFLLLLQEDKPATGTETGTETESEQGDQVDETSHTRPKRTCRSRRK